MCKISIVSIKEYIKKLSNTNADGIVLDVEMYSINVLLAVVSDVALELSKRQAVMSDAELDDYGYAIESFRNRNS